MNVDFAGDTIAKLGKRRQPGEALVRKLAKWERMAMLLVMGFFLAQLTQPAQLSQIETTESVDFPAAEQKKAVTATVRIANAAQRKVGSGVIVARTGAFVYVLTAAHVVADNRGLEIVTFSEADYPKAQAVYRDVRVLAASADRADLAVLKFAAEEKNLGLRPICPPAARPKTDQFPCLLVGCLKGEAPTLQLDRVSATRKARDAQGEVTFWECPRVSPQGRSGGALIDARGQVVGICSGISGGKSYFTHIDEIHRFLKKNAIQWLAEDPE